MSTKSKQCPVCLIMYSDISKHWRMSPCGYPDVDKELEPVFTGSMMGDATLKCTGRNHSMRWRMTNKRYLEYIDTLLGYLSNGVNEYYKDSSSDVFELHTVSHPYFNKYNWYTYNRKEWPDDIVLSSTLLKHYYCQDGGLMWSSDSNAQAEFTMVNEMNNVQTIKSDIEQLGFDCSVIKSGLRLTVSSTKDFIDYICGPVPGYEYKWATDNKERYIELKQLCSA